MSVSLYPSVCQVVGLYRLCGSAAVKKELRDSFEKDSSAVCLSEEQYPDINVLTGTAVVPPPVLTLPLVRPLLLELSLVLVHTVVRPLEISNI